MLGVAGFESDGLRCYKEEVEVTRVTRSGNFGLRHFSCIFPFVGKSKHLNFSGLSLVPTLRERTLDHSLSLEKKADVFLKLTRYQQD